MGSFQPRVTRAGTNVRAQNNAPTNPRAEVQPWKERHGGVVG